MYSWNYSFYYVLLIIISTVCHLHAYNNNNFLYKHRYNSASSALGLELTQTSQHGCTLVRISGKNDDTDDVSDIDIDSVSDAEALLACYGYLQRKNMLSEWSTSSSSSSIDKTFAKKQSKQSMLQELSNRNDHENIGYFWENLNELQYYNPRRRMKYYNRSSISPNIYDQNQINPQNDTKVLKSIEGTRYNFIENFIPQVTVDFDDTNDASVNTKDDGIIQPLAVSDMITSTSALDDMTLTDTRELLLLSPSETNYNVQQEHSPVYLNHNDAWDSSDDVNLDHDTSYMYDETYEMIKFQNRSKSTIQRFSNTTWKEEWYKRRWGTKVGTETSRIKCRKEKSERRVQKIMSNHKPKVVSSVLSNTPRIEHNPFLTYPSNSLQTTTNLLHSQLLADLDDETIATAIQTYIHANQVRSKERKRTNANRKQFLLDRHEQIVQQKNVLTRTTNNTETNNNSEHINIPSASTCITVQHHYHDLHSTNLSNCNPTDQFSIDVQERQRRRSEKARIAYQSRIKNKEVGYSSKPRDGKLSVIKEIFKKYKCSFVSHSSLVDRCRRIDSMLSSVQMMNDTNETTIHFLKSDKELISMILLDIQSILLPAKVSQRKNLLLRIIRDLFQTRGMCIPSSKIHSEATTVMDDDKLHSSSTSTSPLRVANIHDHISSSPPSSVEYIFMTKASIRELGLFIVQQLKSYLYE